MDDLTLRWKLANDLRNENWQEIYQWLNNTPAPEGETAGWTYWKARVAGKMGLQLKQQQLMQEVAKERNYYGFLAAARFVFLVSVRRKHVVS